MALVCERFQPALRNGRLQEIVLRDGVLRLAPSGELMAVTTTDVPMVDVPMVDVGIDADPLATLYGTGLCADKACTQINAGIHAYTPQFPLWADTASKRRWIYLPPGKTIDTSDMDYWVFPQGTKIWKETARNRGQEREETGERVIHVSSGGDGPRVEMSTGGSMFNPEASASPDQEP